MSGVESGGAASAGFFYSVDPPKAVANQSNDKLHDPKRHVGKVDSAH